MTSGCQEKVSDWCTFNPSPRRAPTPEVANATWSIETFVAAAAAVMLADASHEPRSDEKCGGFVEVDAHQKRQVKVCREHVRQGGSARKAVERLDHGIDGDVHAAPYEVDLRVTP